MEREVVPVVMVRPVETFRDGEKGETRWPPLDAASFAAERNRTRRNPSDDGDRAVDWTRLRPGVRTVVRLELRFPGNVGLRGEMTDLMWSAKDYVPFQTLPKPFRDAVEG